MTYLTKEMLQQVEDRVELLHKKFREKFGVTETTLRNFKVGDYFSKQKIYMDFDRNMWFNEEEQAKVKVVETNTDEGIGYRNWGPGFMDTFIYINDYEWEYTEYENGKPVDHYDYVENQVWRKPGGNMSRFITSEIGKATKTKVTAISSEEDTYKMIKIKDDRYKLLAYNKKNWADNEFPYMQDIDNIEEGIHDVTEIFYTPAEYVYKPWLFRAIIDEPTEEYVYFNNNGLNQMPISESDFARWNKNIDLLEKAFNDIINIWNLISYINWDEESQFEWEDR